MVREKLTKEAKENKIAKIKEKFKKLTWKYFFQQKLIEIASLPSIILVPYGMGYFVINKIIGYNNYLNFIISNAKNNDLTIPTMVTSIDYWFIGSFALIIIFGFIFINYIIARNRAENKLDYNEWQYL